VAWLAGSEFSGQPSARSTFSPPLASRQKFAFTMSGRSHVQDAWRLTVTQSSAVDDSGE
jgi:hypothetical protein